MRQKAFICSYICILISSDCFSAAADETTTAQKYIDAAAKYINEGNLEAAASELNAGVELSPTPGALLQLAEINNLLGRYKESSQRLRQLEILLSNQLNAEWKERIDSLREKNNKHLDASDIVEEENVSEEDSKPAVEDQNSAELSSTESTDLDNNSRNEQQIELERRQTVRKKIKGVLYVGGTYMIWDHSNDIVQGDVESDAASWSDEMDGGAGSVGFGIRHNFTFHFGWQARLRLSLGAFPKTYETEPSTVWDGDIDPVYGTKKTGLYLNTVIDVTFRFGPVAWAVPVYFGFGPMGGFKFVSRAGVRGIAGGLTEFGLLLGQTERIDLNFQFYFGLYNDMGATVTVGIALF